jgi:hypothetical protein
MNRSVCRRTLASLAAAILCVSASSSTARAQARTDRQFDTDAFRAILMFEQFEPLTEFGQLLVDKTPKILIVFGETTPLSQVPAEWLKSFVRGGGALLVATDQWTTGALAKAFHVGVTGIFVESTASGYRGMRDFPFVEPLGKNSPLFRTPQRIATNKPSFLESQKGAVPTLATFPRDCQPTRDRTRFASPLVFAAGGDFGDGQILVLADHSVFINGMMLQTDNGNFDFAYNCLRWLSNGGARRQVLFYDEGKIVPDFHVPLTTVPDLGVSPVDLANRMIVAAERENLFNRLILEHVSMPRVLSTVAVVLTLGLALYGFYRLIHASYAVDSKVPLVTRSLSRLIPEGKLVDQRHQALLREGNFWEAARDLARDCLAALGYDPQTAVQSVSPAVHPPQPPRIFVQSGWWQRPVVRSRVRRFWHLAHDAEPVPISRRQFDRLLAQAEELKAAAHDGKLRLVGSGGQR